MGVWLTWVVVACHSFVRPRTASVDLPQCKRNENHNAKITLPAHMTKWNSEIISNFSALSSELENTKFPLPTFKVNKAIQTKHWDNGS